MKYSDEIWKQRLREHLTDKHKFNAYNEHIYKELEVTIDWLKEWGCSRSFGLGTRVPWDEQFVIESLSDSTIYMAYYTISHYL